MVHLSRRPHGHEVMVLAILYQIVQIVPDGCLADRGGGVDMM